MPTGKNVILRPIERCDIALLVKWLNDPQVNEHLDVDSPVTELALQKDVDPATWFMIDVPSEARTVGSTRLKNINNRDRRAEFSIVIGEKEFWGRGIGTEAVSLLVSHSFEQLDLHRISSEVFSLNDRSIRMHAKLGFREEGRQREVWFKNGRYYDAVLFGLLKSEWKDQDPKCVA